MCAHSKNLPPLELVKGGIVDTPALKFHHPGIIKLSESNSVFFVVLL